MSASAMEGLNIDGIPGDLRKKELCKVVEKRLDSSKIQISIQNGSGKGDNFMGDVHRVLFKSAEDDDEHIASLILKIAPGNLERREKFNLRNLFLGEIIMYDEVLRFFDDFQLSKGVMPAENGFNEYAKCYQSISDELSESLFLEDLTFSQFEMINLRKEELTFDHMAVYLKALGKFHGISLAIKDQQPKKFKQLHAHMNEKFCWRRAGIDRFIAELIDCLDKESHSDILEKVKQAIGDDPCETVKKLVLDATDDRFAVICHGDLTVKNAMFRKNAQGKPIEFRMFDWQFTRCASPIIDLVVFLLCCTTKELRDKHYDEFLRIYHESLADLMKRLGSDPQKLFPFEELLNQLRKYGVYAIYFGALLLPMLFSELESMPDYDTSSGNDNDFHISNDSKQTYQKRITDIFVDMARLGYI